MTHPRFKSQTARLDYKRIFLCNLGDIQYSKRGELRWFNHKLKGIVIGMIGSISASIQDPSVTRQKVRVGTARRMLRFALPYSSRLAVFLLVVIVEAGITVVIPLIFREIVNKGILAGNPAVIFRFAALLGILGLISGAFQLAQSYISASIGARIVLGLRTKLFDHIQEMPLAFFTRVQTGALTSRLNTDVMGAQGAFTAILSNVVGNCVTLGLVLGAMFMLSWRMSTVAIILIPIFVIPAHFLGRKLQEITRESFSLIAAMNNLMIERFNVAGAYVAKLFGRPRDESKEFRSRAERVSEIGVKRAVYGGFFFAALGLVGVFATAYAYGWGGMMVVKRSLDLGTLVAFVSYLGRLYGAFTGLSNLQVTVMTALVSFDRVFEVLDLPPMISDRPHALPLPRRPAQVRFDHVFFRYPTAAEISLASLESIAISDKSFEPIMLLDINFVAEPGQLIALVGPSGGGKTTISHLVSRLYDVQSGSVSINGIDVRDASLESLHQMIGIVTQDAHLFHDTVRSNLLYAKPEATEEELTEALRAAQILPRIASLPKGLESLVGDGGYRFSGGEKQRLCIARLLLKAPEIIILDEATAHLDSESEIAIHEALETALRGRTSIVIAHRLSTIRKADQILVVNEGRIVERGTHRELLNRPGLYSKLYECQFSNTGLGA